MGVLPKPMFLNQLGIAAFLFFSSLLQAQPPAEPKVQGIASAGWSNSVPSSGTLLETHAKAGFKRNAKSSQNSISTLPGITYLGSVPTPSPAQSFALNGNLAYVCGRNEISIVNISNPASPLMVGTAFSSQIADTELISCSVERNALVVFADQINSSIGNKPGFAAFNLTNPTQPQLIANTAIDKRFFQNPIFNGNYAFVPTSATTYFFGWSNQHGDLLAFDLTNFAAPSLVGTLAQPQISTQFGGANSVFGITQADSNTAFIGGSTSVESQNNGTGRLQVVDISLPSAMKVVREVAIPGSVHFYAPLLQGPVAVGIGNTGGYVGSLTANPSSKGNIVVATFDVSDRRTPILLSSRTTNYSVGYGGGATRIGNNLFAFAGVLDSANNPVLLIVDTTDPKNPFLQGYPIPQPFTSMQAVGSTLYATLGSGGFATFSIPGLNSTTFSCPLSLSSMIVFDVGPNVSPATFTSAKVAAKSFIDSLHLAPDQVGIVASAATSSLSYQLSASGQQAKFVLDGFRLAPTSHLGSGITAAQTELSGPRRTPTSTPIILVVSDGSDRSAPNAGATTAAASAAKASGTRIISLQYGSATPSPLMQSIASSPSDFYLVP